MVPPLLLASRPLWLPAPPCIIRVTPVSTVSDSPVPITIVFVEVHVFVPVVQIPPRDPACNQIDNVLLLLDSLDRRGGIPDNALEHIGEAAIQIESVKRIVCE